MALEQPFRFLDLPAELRNEIYRLTFEGSTTRILRTYSQVSNTATSHITHVSPSGQEVKGLPGVLHVNQQLRSESETVFYSVTTFITYLGDALAAWLKFLSPKARAALRSVCLRTWVLDDVEHDSTEVKVALLRVVQFFAAHRSAHGLDREDFSDSLVSYEVWTVDEVKRVYPVGCTERGADR